MPTSNQFTRAGTRPPFQTTGPSPCCQFWANACSRLCATKWLPTSVSPNYFTHYSRASGPATPLPPHYSTLPATGSLALGHGLLCGVLFLDVAEALENINHSLLIKKLRAMHISPQTVSWIQSLHSRTQAVTVGNTVSAHLNVCWVFHKVSSWGLLCFHFCQWLTPGHCWCHSCSFDTTIYGVGRDVASIPAFLCSALHLADEWICSNHLGLNVNKCKSMLIHSARKSSLPLLPPSCASQQLSSRAGAVNKVPWCHHQRYSNLTRPH